MQLNSPRNTPNTRKPGPATGLADGTHDAETCYWGDAVFFPHLLNLLSKPKVRATVRFAPVEQHSTDRKELAQQLHAAVSELKG